MRARSGRGSGGVVDGGKGTGVTGKVAKPEEFVRVYDILLQVREGREGRRGGGGGGGVVGRGWREGMAGGREGGREGGTGQDRTGQ